MPTNPTTPNTNASVDRLALGVDSLRGTEPSAVGPHGPCLCYCFEAETSVILPLCASACTCFEDA